MKVKLLLTGILVLVISAARGQVSDPDQLETGNTDVTETISHEKATDRFDFGMSVGTGFIYSPGYFYGPSLSISPGLSYKISPEFILSAGLIAERMYYYPVHSAGDDDMLPMTRAFLYAKGSYLLSPRLVLSGTAYKSTGNAIFYPDYSHDNMRIRNYDYQGVDFGIDYKLSRSFSIGIHMRVQDRGYYPGLSPQGNF
jgi:hypothetical protein